MTAWEFFVKQLHEDLGLWFMCTAFLGGAVGWKLCCLLKFSEIKMAMHERRIMQLIEKEERKGGLLDLSPLQQKNPHLDQLVRQTKAELKRPVEKKMKRFTSGQEVYLNQPTVENQKHHHSGIDPLTGLLILDALSSPAPVHAHEVSQPAHDTPSSDCSPSGDSGYSSDSSSSDCGSSSSSDSGSSGGGDM